MRRVVTYVGFGIAILLLMVIVLVGLLFLLPQLNLFGATSVSLADHYTRYDDAGIKAILANRNIIVESSGIDVEIRSRKYGQSAAGTIVVFENASGIAFNSMDRTLIDYLQYVDDNGEVWHKIVILEPQGAVSLKGHVHIYLYANDEPELLPQEYRQPYNIILNTKNSKVDIATDPDSTYLRIDNMYINNVSGFVNFPTVERDQPKVVDLGNLTVNSSARVTFNCRAPIRGSVNINSANGVFNVGDIGVKGEGAGNVTIKGDQNAFNTYGGTILGNIRAEGKDVRFTAGKVFGSVFYQAKIGHMTVEDCARMEAEVVDANVNVVGKIDGGTNTDGVPELRFTGTGRGWCKVNQVIGVSRVKSEDGDVELRKVAGGVTIDNTSGATVVEFDNSLDSFAQLLPTCDIDAWNGNVTVSNIIGPTRITVAKGGKARAFVSFLAVNGLNIIDMQGETDPKNRYHSVEATIIKVENQGIAPFNVTANYTSRARHYTNFITNNNNSPIEVGWDSYYVMDNGRTYHAGIGSSTNVLIVNTDDWFDLFYR